MGTRLLLAGLLLLAGCTSEVYGVIGDQGDLFTGKMSGGTEGRLELDNGKGTRCVGDFSGRRSTGMAVAKVLLGGVDTLQSSLPSSGRATVSCSDGQQAFLQFKPTGGESGYGFGQTRDGRPVRFTYGLNKDESTPYLRLPPTQTATTPGGTGSGFYITRQGHVLTAAHVVDGCRQITVTPNGGASVGAQVIATDKQNDLAVLLGGTPPAVATLRTGRPVRTGEAVVAYGFPLTGALSSGGTLTSGTVNALTGLGDDVRYFQISAPIQPGNSGGPLLDNSGTVIGVVTSQINALKVARVTGSVPQNVNFALKADFVRTFLDANSIDAAWTPPGRDLSTPDIGERARAFSVFIECRN